MKFRIIEEGGLFYPQYKKFLFWVGIPVREHTWEYTYVTYALNEQQALDAIERFKNLGDISKPKTIFQESK